MSEKPADYGREVRDTIVKSSLTGVAATVLAVTIFSPAGFGGLVGTSLASGFGADPNAASADDPYANLPPFPAMLSADEVDSINGQLASTTASLELTRAATEEKIERIRSIALSTAVATFAPTPHTADVGGLRLTMSVPEETAAPQEAAPVQAAARAAPVRVSMTPVNYAPIAAPEPIEYRDTHLELAELLLARDTF